MNESEFKAMALRVADEAGWRLPETVAVAIATRIRDELCKGQEPATAVVGKVGDSGGSNMLTNLLPMGTKLYLHPALPEALRRERDGAVSILEQTLCGISFKDLQAAYAAYRAGEKYETVVDRLEALLAASQAREQQLREALQRNADYRELADGDVPKYIIDALTLPQDDTALNAWGAKLLRRLADKYVLKGISTVDLRGEADELEGKKC